ncbi:iron uptake transporter permease EfeU [Frankia sp. R82]|uniref:iron uptake transporter permease EfeU n=1 Tax=Frankia sp. R82 TaxID=2950553 RepID=UPI002044320D|nr:iron uptake transporter permease EfeU [Frankia sp. R82]MCM3887147.1 FTR1 family protein [Frankia sp. R82]
MLPTFVIGLREGLEAALIVGIVAAFLRQRDRRDALRQVWLGVGLALLLCIAVGIGLHVLDHELPQREQEGLETVIGLIAVAMVTYMIVWMRRHSRDLRASLESATESALEKGSTQALVLMAFLAVLREGFETAVFLIAAFNASDNAATAGGGALLGVLVAVIIGFGIYRGGVRINLARFFRVTGIVLVVIAAGLLATAAHTGHEAGWLDVGQGRAVDLSWLVRPGTVLASVLTGVLGLQPRPVVAEVVAWLVYLVPLLLYVTWPARRRPTTRPPAAESPVSTAGSPNTAPRVT